MYSRSGYLFLQNNPFVIEMLKIIHHFFIMILFVSNIYFYLKFISIYQFTNNISIIVTMYILNIFIRFLFLSTDVTLKKDANKYIY